MAVEMPAPATCLNLGISADQLAQSLQRLGHAPAAARAAAQFALNGAKPGDTEQELVARALRAAAGMTTGVAA